MIYLVISGEYSDWDTEGYFTDLETAEKYCVLKNVGRDYGELYIKEVDLITATEAVINVKYRRLHEVVFDSKRGSLRMRNEELRYKTYIGEKKDTKITRNDFIKVVEVDCWDRKVAEKIAQDVIYEAIAKEKGIC